ncbi:MAG: glucokinase [Xenococcaceae cyanobacterium]
MNEFLLAAHIGGTKARLCLQKPAQKNKQDSFNFSYETRYSIGNFQDAFPLVKQFLIDAGQELRIQSPNIKGACLAVAGPVKDNKCKMSNWPLEIDGNLLAQKLGVDPKNVKLINDFESVAYGIKELNKLKKYDSFVTLQKVEPQNKGLIVVIGAATGLGKSFLVQKSDGEEAYPTEGGHIDFAPRTDLEFKLWQYIIEKIRIENKRPLDRVSVERVVSGRGIMSIYRFLRDYPDREQLLQQFKQQRIDELEEELLEDIEKLREAPNTSSEIEQMIKTWQEEDKRCRESVDPAAVIASAALAKRDLLSMRTMQMFVEIYGAVTGNLALQFLPYGGLYIAGGIAPQILPLILERSFLQAFHQKGRMSKLLEKIPVYVVKDLEVGLIGAARYAATKMKDVGKV